MSKRRKRLDSPPRRQTSILDYIEQIREMDRGTSEGVLNVRNTLRNTIAEAIKNCPMSRHQVAGEMSHLLGVDVTKSMLDAWTAESKDGHRFPAEFLPAFCKVVECQQPLAVLNEAAGILALPGPDALRGEIQRLREDENKARRARRKRERFLKELEFRASI